jgi:hypothetical protein
MMPCHNKHYWHLRTYIHSYTLTTFIYESAKPITHLTHVRDVDTDDDASIYIETGWQLVTNVSGQPNEAIFKGLWRNIPEEWQPEIHSGASLRSPSFVIVTSFTCNVSSRLTKHRSNEKLYIKKRKRETSTTSNTAVVFTDSWCFYLQLFMTGFYSPTFAFWLTPVVLP